MIGGRVIVIDGSKVADDLRQMGVQLDNLQPAFMLAARAVDNTLKKHFREKNQVPNKRGFPKSDFWAQIRSSVQTLAIPNGATVQVNDPRLNTHVFGATITPKSARALAIPVVAEAYGVRPATFDNLVAIRTGKGKGNTVGLLAKKDPTRTILQVMYVLVKRVVIPADPTALPAEEALQFAAVSAFESWLERKLASM